MQNKQFDSLVTIALGNNANTLDFLFLCFAFALGVFFEWNIVLVCLFVCMIYCVLRDVHIEIGAVAAATVGVYVIAIILHRFELLTQYAELLFASVYGAVALLIMLIARDLNGGAKNVLPSVQFMKHFSIATWLKVVLIATGASCGLVFAWSVTNIVLFVLFLWTITARVDPRKIAIIALVLALSISVLLVLGREEQVEEYAVYLYYLLATAVLRIIMDTRQEMATTTNYS